MRAYLFLCFNNNIIFSASKIHLRPPSVAYAAVRSKAVVLLLLICCFIYPHCLWWFCIGFWFGMHYFVSFLVLQSS